MDRQQGPDGEERVYRVGENFEDEVGAAAVQAFYEEELREGAGGRDGQENSD